MRFAILEKIDREGKEKIILEYDIANIAEKLCSYLSVSLLTTKKPFRGFSDKAILEFAKEAFNKTVVEFKQESVRL
jgi:hypothetical protein